MKLQSINSINFGYNAEYHRNIQKKLLSSKKYKEIAKNLALADKFLVNCEDEILNMEKNGTYTKVRYLDFTSFYIELKDLIALYTTMLFPELNYAKTEEEQYKKEAKKIHSSIKEDWRNRLSKKMREYTGENLLDKKTEQNPKESQKINEISPNTTVKDIIEQAVDNYKDLQANDVLEKYTPSLASPKGFEDVAGMGEIKEKLYDNVVSYSKNPDLALLDYEEYGIKAPRGFLFYGPPGCGKTFITQALSAESGLTMYKLDVSKAGSKYVNQTSNNLKKAFDFLKHEAKKEQKPILLFMDEVDSFAMSRGDVMSSDENMKTVSTLLKLIEEARDNNIIIIAATNKYNLLDEAFKARFDGQIYFPLPDKEQIKELLKKSLSSRTRGVALANSEKEIDILSEKLKGYSNRSITFILDEAAKIAKKDARRNIAVSHVEQAISESELEKSNEKEYKQKLANKSLGFN